MAHRDIARYLYDKHKCTGWWSQMVAVEYERARGLRARHETPEGYQVSVSKTISVSVKKLY